MHLLAMLRPMQPPRLSSVDERFLSTLYVQDETCDGRLAQNTPCRKRVLISRRLLLSSRVFHRLSLRFASPPNTALVLRLSGGSVDSSSVIDLEFGSGGGAEGDEAGESDQGVRRYGKGGIGRGKAGIGLARRHVERQYGARPLTSPSAQEKGRADDAMQGEKVSDALVASAGAGADSGAGPHAEGTGGIEDEVREMERERAARRGAASRRKGGPARPRNEGSGRAGGKVRPKGERAKANSSGGSARCKKWEDAKLSAPTRTLRERSVAVNYQEESESTVAQEWQPDDSAMSDDLPAQQNSGEERRASTRIRSRAAGAGATGNSGRVRGRRAKQDAKGANPLGQELSESEVQADEDRVFEGSSALREPHKWRLDAVKGRGEWDIASILASILC